MKANKSVMKKHRVFAAWNLRLHCFALALGLVEHSVVASYESKTSEA